jgi:hypothetical protein
MSRLLRRPRWLLLIAIGTVLFLAISAILARFFQLDNVERDAELSVLMAETRGDAASMHAQLHDCIYGCPADVRVDARTLKRPGQVLILAWNSQTSGTLTTKEGWTRVAWKAGDRLPVVQCFRVQRKGNVISGLTVTLLRVSRPIPTTADC